MKDLLNFSFLNFRFDFDGDNLISPEEVFILLSYIPFKNSESHSSNTQASKQKGSAAIRLSSAENTGGSYSRSHAGTPMNQEQRGIEQREIKAFV